MNIDFYRMMDSKLRGLLLRLYNLIAPWVSKIGITKMKIGTTTLGQKIYAFIFSVLNYRLPDPIYVNGMKMFHHTPDGLNRLGHVFAFNYEPQTSLIFEQIVKPSMVVVDIGANIGYYTLLSAKLTGVNGKVYAFEPVPFLYSLLQKNISANGLENRVEAFPLAIGDHSEKKCNFYLGELMVESSLFHVLGTGKSLIEVEMASLDDFFRKHNWPAVDIVKIDAEGADKIIVEGMRQVIMRNPGLKLVIEFNPVCLQSSGIAPEELLILLKELGFYEVHILFWKTLEYRRIPEDNQYILNVAKKVSYVNLLCERAAF
jgi:FkbM family methyltransferase